MSESIRIGLAGLGTVGCSVLHLLHRHAESLSQRSGRTLRVVGVSARDRHRSREVDISNLAWFEDPVALASSEAIDVFVELIGGEEGPARDAVETALKCGKSVVTANKALLAKHGMALAQLAEERHVTLAFEASVAGGIPIVKTLKESLASNSIQRVYGILNGTCNYILSHMAQKRLPFEVCLQEAQKLGYAESDPSFDVGGFDVAHKLAILTSLSFGTVIDCDAIHVEGIETITLEDLHAAESLGYRIKLLGVAQKTPQGVEQRVHPTMVPLSSPLAQVNGVINAVTIDADAVHELTLVGPGAGGLATASSVVADLSDIARGQRSAPFGRPVAQLEHVPRLPVQRHEGGYYIRFSVRDRVGALAAIVARMAEKKISIETIVQHGEGSSMAKADSGISVFLLTHATTESLLREALDLISKDGFILVRPQVIRIEREEMGFL